MRFKIIILVMVVTLGSFGIAIAQGPAPESCWGQASKVFAQAGEMGEHASQQPNPRLGLRNLARALFDAGVIPDDSMQALGVFVATELGLSIDACMNTSSIILEATPSFGSLYYEGMVVRTIVPPAAIPTEGRDDLYVIPGQLAVAAVAPGDRDYHGGHWAFHSVTWNVAPYLLTSEAEVLAASVAGDVDITRVPDNDFRCPIQP
jgi:hypothetical protein